MLIEYIEDKNDPSGVWKGYVYAGSMFVAAVLQSIVLHQYFHTMFTLGMRMRSAIIGLVYEKVTNKMKLHRVIIVKLKQNVITLTSHNSASNNEPIRTRSKYTSPAPRAGKRADWL